MKILRRLGAGVLILGLLVWVGPSFASPGDKKSSDSEQGPATLTGCLQQRAGQYMLVDKDGIAHRLAGGKNLKSYLKHEVELTGTPATRTIDTTPAGGASSATEVAVFEIKTVKDMAPTCQSGVY